MTPSRRAFLASAAALAVLPSGARALDGSRLGLRPGAPDDQSSALEKALARAAAAGEALYLAPGTYRIDQVKLPDGTRLLGEPGATRLLAGGDVPALVAAGARRIAVETLAIEGASRKPADDVGLISATEVRDLTLGRLAILSAAGHGVRLQRCGGRLRDLEVSDVRATAIFSLDATGLSIEGCRIADIDNNGIQIWRTVAGWDGTLLRGNRVERIAALGGGSGQNGNGINIFRAGGVIVADTQADDCAFSAVRANSASDIAIRGTTARNMGEVAIFVEFGFSGAVVAGNIVERAAAGIAVTNFNEGGRLATVQGNVLRDLFRRADPESGHTTYGYGIAAEADTTITGNVVETAEAIGINLGWGPYLRDVTASGNLVRGAPVGFGISVAPGAGRAAVVGNTIVGATRGAVLGYAWEKVETGDLAAPSAAIDERLVIANNMVSG